MNNKITEDDKKKIVEFLNFVAKKATFEMNTQEVIEYFKLLSFMQQSLLVKIDANILEIKRVVDPVVEQLPLQEPKKGKK